MTTYPKRPYEVVNCTDVYVYDITMQNETPCDDSGGNCVWIGTLKASVYNCVEPVTYSWTTSEGIINSGQDEESCEIWIDGDHPMTFEVSVTINCANGTHSKTVEFETKSL